VSGDVEQVGNRIMDRDEALQMSLRFEALHDPLSSPDWLVGILRSIVQAFVGAVLDAGHDLSLCGFVGLKFVGNHYTRRAAMTLQQFAHQALSRLGISATLNQHLKNETILIDGAPEPVLLTADRNDGFIEMPLVAKPTG